MCDSECVLNGSVLMDIVFLHGLKAHCVIGVWGWEKQITQLIGIDLDLAADIVSAASTDQLADALDYKSVAQRVRDFAEESRFQLLETLAENIAVLVMNEFAVPWVRVGINKGGVVKNCDNVGIIIERGTNPDD
jgi:dihydroneopterin aldolase